MGKLLRRKLLLLILLLPLLNIGGYYYAMIHPQRPGWQQEEIEHPPYSDYLTKLLQGDLGTAGPSPVSAMVNKQLVNSLILVGAAIVFTAILGPLIGVLLIDPKKRSLYPWGAAFLAAGGAMPGFMLGGIILAYIVYQTLYMGSRDTMLPLGGYGLDAHLIIPTFVLAARPTLQIAQITATLLQQEWQQDYIQVARSKGLSWWQLLWFHALPNIRSAIIITIGQSMRMMVGSLIIVESLVNWPGIGRTFIYALGVRLDGQQPYSYFASPDLIAILAVIIGGWLLLADLLAAIFAYISDPRLRQEGNA